MHVQVSPSPVQGTELISFTGAPVEAAFSTGGRYAYVSNYSMYGAGFEVRKLWNVSGLTSITGASRRVHGPNGLFAVATPMRLFARAAKSADEILYADVDYARNAASHARQLFMQHRRPELYRGWLG